MGEDLGPKSLKLRICTGRSRIRENSEAAVVAGPAETPPNSHEFGYANFKRRVPDTPGPCSPRKSAQPSCDVQWGQRVALSGIADWQKGHGFVVASAGGSGFLVNRLTCLMTMKMQNATMRKSSTLLMNLP